MVRVREIVQPKTVWQPRLEEKYARFLLLLEQKGYLGREQTSSQCVLQVPEAAGKNEKANQTGSKSSPSKYSRQGG